MFVLQDEDLPCVNHPERTSRANLDGDELCQECADQWARNERADDECTASHRFGGR